MALISTQNEFHVAINGNGLILQGAPGRPAYSQQQAPTYGQRFASGDRSYNDLSKWWYFAQTDWAGGFRDDVSWEDDATFFASTNVDTWSELGAVKLITGLSLENDFSDTLMFGSYETVLATPYAYVGTKDDSSLQPKLYRKSGGSWTELISGYIPNSASSVVDAMAHKSKLWVVTRGSIGATQYGVFKCDEDGTNQVNYAGTIATAMGWSTVTGGTTLTSSGSVLYVAVEEVAAGTRKYGIAKTADAGTTWTKVGSLDFVGLNMVLSMVISGSDLVYLVEKGTSGTFELRSYDLVNDIDIFIQNFISTTAASTQQAASRRMLHQLGGKIIVVVPDKELWQYDPANGTLDRILSRDSFKNDVLTSNKAESSWSVIFPNESVLRGGVVHDNKLWFGNLMYDGQYFYNTKKNFDDSLTNIPLPVFSNGTSLYWISATDLTKLYVDSGFKGSADKNYILFSNFDVVSSIDKLLYSATILFKTLATGQKISVEYLTGELSNSSSFTLLGSASYSVDGAVNEKKLFFPVGTTFKKVWIRVKLEGDGATTPTLTDVIFEYLPMPTQSKLWSMSVNCGESVKKLNGRLNTKTGRELRALLEMAWWSKSILDFQDFDYATTTLSGSLSSSATTINVETTSHFPEQGRIVIDDEQCFYTDKTPTSFTGVTRGVRDSKAAAHSSGAVVNNAYKIIVTNFSEQIPVALDGKRLEYIVDIEVREV